MQTEYATEKPGLLNRLQRWMQATHLMMGGLVMTTHVGRALLQARFPHLASSWKQPILIACILADLWLLCAAESGMNESAARNSTERSTTIFLAILCMGVLYWQREQVWTVLGAGAAGALMFYRSGKIRGRFYAIAITGWILAGLCALSLPWPNSQRLELVIVLGGVGTALQGLLDLPRNLRLLRHQSEGPAAEYSWEQSGEL